MTNTQREQELALINLEIERLTEEVQRPSQPGHHKLRIQVTRDGVTMTQWMDVPDDFIPAPANRPIQAQPILRTATKPNHLTWKDMDRKNWHRTGAPWHTCPNCTTFHLTEAVKVTDADGDTTWQERHTVAGYLNDGELKPVTGMNLYRHVDGHEECWDCGWKGATPDHAVIRQERAAKQAKAKVRNVVLDQARAAIRAITAGSK